MPPLVSIVTATRNRKELLERLIRSVRTQTYPAVEHIVVDGASNDGTPELLKVHAHHYNLRWHSEPDRNQVEAINKGLKMATGEFVTITHDDDYWLPEGIEILMKEIAKNPDLDLVYGDSWGEHEDGRRTRRSYAHYSHSDMVNRGYQIPQDGALFRRSWLEKAGYLNEEIEYVPEYELFLRIIEAGGRYAHVASPTSVAGLHDMKKSWRGYKRAWRETRRVNRAHGGAFFSPFTVLYLKNRYLGAPAAWCKKHLPSLYARTRKSMKLPTYGSAQ